MPAPGASQTSEGPESILAGLNAAMSQTFRTFIFPEDYSKYFWLPNK